MIRDANEVLITFAGSNESGSSIVAGDINRVTGELWANSTMRDDANKQDRDVDELLAAMQANAILRSLQQIVFS